VIARIRAKGKRGGPMLKGGVKVESKKIDAGIPVLDYK